MRSIEVQTVTIAFKKWRFELSKWSLITLFLATPQLGVSQVQRDTVDRWVSKYCECIANATSSSEVYSCNIEGDTVSIKLSEYDSFYLIRKMIRACGREKQRFDEKPTDLVEVDNLMLKTCTYLRENNLKKFNLKQKLTSLSETMKMIETWEPESQQNKEQIVLQFIQHRQILDSLTTKPKSQEKKQEWIGNESQLKSDTAIQRAVSLFDSFALVEAGDSKGWRYSVSATKGRLQCTMVILLREKNPDIIKEFIDVLADKVKNCDF